MATPPTVLSHLILTNRFAVHPENLATEALAFILRESLHARAALGRFVTQLGHPCDGDLQYETQDANDEGSRPDLIGKHAGEVRLLLEAKFWAGLTEAQPNSYLKSLTKAGALLLFVTPAARIQTVWPQLLRRATEGGFPTGAETTPGKDSRCVSVGDRGLAITSWRMLLESLEQAVANAGDTNRAADIRQLMSLCEQMDTEAFLPLRSEEITSTMGRRIIEFGNLALAVSDALIDKQLANGKNLRAAGGNGYYGRYLRLKGHACFISFNAWRWATWGESPLWMGIRGPDWKYSNVVKDALTSAGIAFRDSAEDGCLVPLVLLTGIEREGVLAQLVEQAVRIAGILPHVSASDPATSSPDPEATVGSPVEA